MTRYPAWKKHQIQRGWRNIIVIFVTVILVFAVLNGFLKTFSLKNYLGHSKWDGQSSLAVAIGASSPSVLIFQKDPQKITFIKLNANSYFETGDFKEPLKKFSSIVNERNGEKLSRVFSLTFLSKIDNYIFFENDQEVNEKFVHDWFKDFASIATPIKILKGKLGGEIQNTNITRIDLIKLWWQAKSLSINRVNLVDISSGGEEIVTRDNQKVLGADTEFLHREIAKYLENFKMVQEDFKIDVRNASGITSAGKLVTDFVTSVGGKVVKIENAEDLVEKTTIVSSDKNAYTTRYLANIFNCDITTRSKNGKNKEITIVIGQDFAARYLE